jgi:hypothetical protein
MCICKDVDQEVNLLKIASWMMLPNNALQIVQALQFEDLDAANSLLKNFFAENFCTRIQSVSINPSSVSLNSITGHLIAENNEKLFFKTHVEPQSVINEYYNSGILTQSGYLVIEPVFCSTDCGKQFLIYRYIDLPSMFCIVKDLERNGAIGDHQQVVVIQQKSDKSLLEIYIKTLQFSRANELRSAPIHQLFFHRLTGGRFDTFYRDKDVCLPLYTLKYDSIADKSWIINGRKYERKLKDIINMAIKLLNPSTLDTPSIVGHGDAHNGNLFFDKFSSSLIHFDPAFAGRHSPFLDLAKPLFHNVFGFWMYFPLEVNNRLNINMEIQDNTIVLEHDFVPSQLRIDIFHSKISYVLKPLLVELKSRSWLHMFWKDYLKLALFCCSFLTLNLCDSKLFPPEITLLGFAISIEMGSTCNCSSLLDFELDSLYKEISI